MENVTSPDNPILKYFLDGRVGFESYECPSRRAFYPKDRFCSLRTYSNWNAIERNLGCGLKQFEEFQLEMPSKIGILLSQAEKAHAG